MEVGAAGPCQTTVGLLLAFSNSQTLTPEVADIQASLESRPCRISGSGLRTSGSGFQVSGSGILVSGSELRVSVSGFGFQEVQ